MSCQRASLYYFFSFYLAVLLSSFRSSKTDCKMSENQRHKSIFGIWGNALMKRRKESTADFIETNGRKIDRRRPQSKLNRVK